MMGVYIHSSIHLHNVLNYQVQGKLYLLNFTEIREIQLSAPRTGSSGQSSWLQIQRSGFDSRRYQIFWEVVGLERDPLSLVSTIEELLGRKSSGSDLENRDYGRRGASRWPRGNHYPQKLALTSPTSGGRSVDIVRSRIQATECVGREKPRPVVSETTDNTRTADTTASENLLGE
jgi:hypothetical protein